MLKRKILLISIFLVGLLAVSAVSAADNATDDIVTAQNANETISVQDTSISDESHTIKEDASNNEPVLRSNDNNAVSSECKVCEKNTDEVLGAVNPDSSEAEPVLKAQKIKTVKMKVKYKWMTKKVGKYKIKARLWKVIYLGGYVNYLDIILYKNGKQQPCSKYISKYRYKDNGRWKWWSSWRYGGVDHSYHRYVNDRPINMIKVKFIY